MTTTKQRLDTIRNHLESEFGERLRGVVLYGSEARGESSADSDIDVLVLLNSVPEFGKDLRRCIDALFPLALEWGRPISPKPIPIRQYETIDCPLFRHARKEGMAA